MARRPRLLFENALYHVTFRGNARQDIFLDAKDRNNLLERMADCAEQHNVVIYLYCFLTNHVHLMIQTPNANLDQFMARLLTGYCVYFNRKHQRSGHLMQGRYGAQVVSGDSYLLNLSRYIHVNPVKTTYWSDKPVGEQVDFLRQYAWSSYRMYIGVKAPPSWLHTDPILAMTADPNQADPRESYRRFVEAGLVTQDEQFKRQVHANPLAFGSDDFVRDMKLRYQREAVGRIKNEDAALRKDPHALNPALVYDTLVGLNGFQGKKIFLSRLGIRERCAAALAWQKYAGLTQREIAAKLGLTTGAAVSVLISRYGRDPRVTQWLTELDLTFKG